MTQNININSLTKNLSGWKGVAAVCLILLCLAVVAYAGGNVSVNASLQIQLQELQAEMNIPVNSTVSAFIKTASYIIAEHDAYTCLFNGSVEQGGHLIEFDTNASREWIDAVGNVTANNGGGGSIYVEYGSYQINNLILINSRHIQIFADPNTTIVSSLLPCFQITGAGMDNVSNVVNDIEISNLRFLYDGPVASGSFVEVDTLQNDNMFQGAVIFTNIVILSNQTSVPANAAFIGLQINETIGVEWNYLSVDWFGTGIQLSNTIWQGSTNSYNNVNVGYCTTGVAYAYHANDMFTVENWRSTKIMHTLTYGMFVDAIDDIEIDTIQFESCSNVALALAAQQSTVTNGVFSSFGSIGIDIFGNGAGVSTATLTENRFVTGTTGIQIDQGWHVQLNGNYYTGTTYNVTMPYGISWLSGSDPALPGTVFLQNENISIDNIDKYTTLCNSTFDVGCFLDVSVNSGGNYVQAYFEYFSPDGVQHDINPFGGNEYSTGSFTCSDFTVSVASGTNMKFFVNIGAGTIIYAFSCWITQK